MKRIRFQSGEGNGQAIVNGQLLGVTVVAGNTDGSYLKINESGPIFVPSGRTLGLDALAFGFCCGEPECDRYPGDQQITIVFGEDAEPLGATSEPPLSWLVVYNGC